MDDGIEYFLSNFGAPIEQQAVPETSFKKYKGHLPDQLLDYWRTFGWCGFAQGLFWMCNPEEWDEAMEQLLEPTGFLERDAYHVIARNAFGDMWLWGEKTGSSLSTLSAYGGVFPSFDPKFGSHGIALEAQMFFGGKDLKAVDLLDEKESLLFKRALKKLGPLKSNEMYGFVPLVAMGGPALLANLQKVDAQVHMSILAEMTPMRVMPDYAAISRGEPGE